MGEKFLLLLGIWKLDLQNEGPVYRASGQGCGALTTAAWRAPHVLSTSSLQEERSRSEHNLVNIQKTHERMQTENKSE